MLYIAPLIASEELFSNVDSKVVITPTFTIAPPLLDDVLFVNVAFIVSIFASPVLTIAPPPTAELFVNSPSIDEIVPPFEL